MTVGGRPRVQSMRSTSTTMPNTGLQALEVGGRIPGFTIPIGTCHGNVLLPRDFFFISWLLFCFLILGLSYVCPLQFSMGLLRLKHSSLTVCYYLVVCEMTPQYCGCGIHLC